MIQKILNHRGNKFIGCAKIKIRCATARMCTACTCKLNIPLTSLSSTVTALNYCRYLKFLMLKIMKIS